MIEENPPTRELKIKCAKQLQEQLDDRATKQFSKSRILKNVRFFFERRI